MDHSAGVGLDEVALAEGEIQGGVGIAVLDGVVDVLEAARI